MPHATLYVMAMASINAISFFSSSTFLLIVIVIPLLFQQAALADSNDKKPSTVEFLRSLQGCQKGDEVKDIHKLKMYLENFGYLTKKNKNDVHDDYFDEFLESAIKTYQLNFHLDSTGILDAETVSQMMMPRCGVADIINGRNWMRFRNKKHHPGGSQPISEVSLYSFFNRTPTPKWPPSKYHLTYAFLPGTRTAAFTPVANAFQRWTAVSQFTFSRIDNYRVADLTISFEHRDHGDGTPFEGPGNVTAHAFPPTDGRFHYDADEAWSVSVTPGAFHLESIAVHEIGHLLGLYHSEVKNAVMWPYLNAGEAKLALNQDDIQGIRALYNL